MGDTLLQRTAGADLPARNGGEAFRISGTGRWWKEAGGKIISNMFAHFKWRIRQMDTVMPGWGWRRSSYILFLTRMDV